MSKILKRPMFRRGGSTNDGIMTGLTDRKQLSTGTLDPERARTEAKQIQDILDSLAPIRKTRLPLGEVGLALAGGADPLTALEAGYRDFVKRDDVRQALLDKRKQAAVSTALGAQLNRKGSSSQIDLKAREAFGKKVVNPTTGKPFTSYNEAYTFFSMSATDPGRRSIPGDVEKSKQNFIQQGTYGDNEILAERHAIANTIVRKQVPKDENYTGKRIKIKDGKYKTEGEEPGIYVDVLGNKIIEINPDGTAEPRPELTAILRSYR